MSTFINLSSTIFVVVVGSHRQPATARLGQAIRQLRCPVPLLLQSASLRALVRVCSPLVVLRRAPGSQPLLGLAPYCLPPPASAQHLAVPSPPRAETPASSRPGTASASSCMHRVHPAILGRALSARACLLRRRCPPRPRLRRASPRRRWTDRAIGTCCFAAAASHASLRVCMHTQGIDTLS